jgi:hypothetical protein
VTVEDDVRRRHYMSGNMCERCGDVSTEIAHSISKGKAGRKAVRLFWMEMFNHDLSEKELDKVIHHRFNTHASCNKCNDYFNVHISHEPMIKDILIKIKEDLDGDNNFRMFNR